jgi:hypothetical protein
LAGLAALWLAVAPGCDRDDLTSGPSRSVPESGPDPGGGPSTGTPADVIVNEFMVLNETTLEDEGGNFSPWIELYNPTDGPIDLGGVPLSDSFFAPRKWLIPQIPEAVIPGGGFLVIFADGDTASNTDLHASFTLTAKARQEVVYNSGSSFVQVNTTAVGPDEAFGRFPDGEGDMVLLSTPTPGDVNTEPSEAPESPVEPEPEEADFVRGDADGDGQVRFADTILLGRIVNGTEIAPACEDRLDANDDGVVDAADQAFLLEALFGTAVIPLPFPDAGADATADSLRCPLE